MALMRLVRNISTRRLVALCAAVVGLLAGATAFAIAATGGGPKPPPEALPVAVHDALTAPQPEGVTARIQFTNHMLSSSDLQGGSPLLSGASGRLWASSDGHVRLELQADASAESGGTSDTQVISDGKQVTVYDSGSNTVYRAALPAADAKDSGAAATEQPPSVEQIKNAIARLMDHATVGAAVPSNVAGQPAYTVRIGPKQDGGLVGGAELAWDAVHGAPLRVAIYAKGDSSPVLELKVTDISYGPVSPSAFDVNPPAGAKVTDLSPSSGGQGDHGDTAPVTGLGNVQQQVSFPVAAPSTLAGMPQSEVRLIQSGKDAGALVTYGSGPGGIAVLEQAANPNASTTPSGGDHSQLTLPSVSINGVQGEELDTPLGTMVRFQRDGIQYTVLGSVPPATAQAAARALP